MITDAGKGVYGIGVRGSRSWATIHPGYLSAFANYGAQDFAVADGKGQAAMNSTAGKEMTALWVKMIQEAGPKNWATYTWYQVGTDLGAGASAMILRRRYSGLLHERRRQQGARAISPSPPSPPTRPPRHPRPTSGSGRWRWRTRPSRRTRPGRSCSGRRAPSTACSARARWTSSTRSAPRSGRTRRSARAFEKSYPGYLAQFEASAPGLEDLLHAAAAVRGGDHRVGGDAAADGRQGGPGRRGPGQAGRQHRRAAEAGRPRLRLTRAGVPRGARHLLASGKGGGTWRPRPSMAIA